MSDALAEQPPRAFDRRRPELVLPVVIVGSAMALVDQYIVNVAVPTIRRELDTSVATVALVVNAYVIAYSVLLVAGARLGERWGIRRAFVVGMAAFTAASIACGAAPSAETLIAARAVQGAAAAVMAPQVYATIHASFLDAGRTRALAVLSGVNGIAAIAAQVVGGLLLWLNPLELSWRALFLVNAPLGVAGIAAALFLLPAAKPERVGRLDAGGIVLLSLALVAVAVPLLEGRQLGWPWWATALLVASAPLLALFAAHERRAKRRGAVPALDVTLFRRRDVGLGTAIAFLLFAQAAGFFFVLTLTLQVGYGLSPAAAGAAFVPLGACFAGGSFLAPRALRRFGPRVLPAAYGVGGLAAAATAAFVLLDRPLSSPWLLVAPLTVQCLCNGLGTAPLLGVALRGVPQRESAFAAGTVTTAIQLGQAFGLSVFALLFAFALGHAGGTTGAQHSGAFGISLAGVAATLGLIAALALRLTTGSSARTSASTARPRT